MITELALIYVKPGSEKDFEATVAKARPLFNRAKGCISVALHRSIEMPSRYRLLVKWVTLQRHVDARNTEDFTTWRAMISPFFAAPPEIEHTEIVLTSAQ